MLLSTKRAGLLPAFLLLPLLLPACSLLPARPAADNTGMLVVDAQGRMQRIETAGARRAQLPDDGRAPPAGAVAGAGAGAGATTALPADTPSFAGEAELPPVPETARTGARNVGALDIDPAQYRTSEEMDVELDRRADERFVMVPVRDGTTLRPVPVSQLTEDSSPVPAPAAELPLLPPDAVWPEHLPGCTEPSAADLANVAAAGKETRKAVLRFPLAGAPLARVPVPDGATSFRLATVVREAGPMLPAVVIVDERLKPLAAGYATLTMTVPESTFAYAQFGRPFVLDNPDAAFLLVGDQVAMAAFLAGTCPANAAARTLEIDHSVRIAPSGQVILEFVHAQQ
jgi:hypothetical protein